MLAHGKSAVYVTEGKYSALFSSLKQLRNIIHRKPLRSRCLKIPRNCPWLWSSYASIAILFIPQ